MSAIDSIHHARVGLFHGIPVYLCLEDSPWLGHEDPEELELSSFARKGSLCIGGGSGEHAAIVLPDVPAAVLAYLRHYQQKARIAWPRLYYCDRKTPEIWAREVGFTPSEDEPDFSAHVTLCIGEFVYFMLPELYDSLVLPKSLDKIRRDLEPWFCEVTLPWDRYRGNGTDYFRVTRKKRVRLASTATP